MNDITAEKGDLAAEIFNPKTLPAIHRYTFGSTSAYAKAWEAFEKRRKDKRDASEIKSAVQEVSQPVQEGQDNPSTTERVD